MRIRTAWIVHLSLSLGALCMEAAAAGPAPDDPQLNEGWPEWRGPLRTGVAPAGDPPAEWSESKNIKWKVKLPGRGTSTPIVWKDRVYIQTAISTGKKAEGEKDPEKDDAAKGKDEGGGRRGRGGRSSRPAEVHQFALLCLDRGTGKTVWQEVAREETPHEGHHPDHGFASFSPATDGQRVFAYFGSRGLHCYGLDGKLQWAKDLGRMRTKNSFGEGSSPGLSAGAVVINWDHEGDDFIIALEKKTGKELWRQPRDEDTSWATPLIVEHQGATQVVTSASRKVRGYDLASGKLLWECSGLTSNVIPSPVAAEGMVYATSGYRGNALLAIRLGKSGDLTGTEALAWKHEKNTPYVPSPLLYGDRLYFFSGNNGILSCLDARTGRAVIDRERLEGIQGVYASPVGAGGKVYLVGRGGAAVVIKHADKLEVLARNSLDEKFDASPAIAGKELFLRGQEHLYCIAER